MVDTLRSSDETTAKRKLRSSPVRRVQIKSNVARTLCPKDLEPLVVKDPNTQKLLSDPADVPKVFGDTLLHLGAHFGVVMAVLLVPYQPLQQLYRSGMGHGPGVARLLPIHHGVSEQFLDSYLEESRCRR